jgi:hypothetical protein
MSTRTMSARPGAGTACAAGPAGNLKRSVMMILGGGLLARSECTEKPICLVW